MSDEGELFYYAHTFSETFTDILLVPISDPHYGNPIFSLKHFDRTINFILDTPRAYTFLNGDLCECVTKTSKGEIYKQIGSPQDQRDWIIEHLKPIKHKILGMTQGNHEDRIARESGIDICKDIAKELNIPYRPTGMLLKISLGQQKQKDRQFVFWGYFTHGYGGARTKSAKAVKIERTATWIHADWYAMSHDHVVNAAPDVYLLPDNRTYPQVIDGKETDFIIGKIVAHRKMLVKTNAYIKWGGYAEQGGFPPTDLATPVIMLLTPKSSYWQMIPDRPQQSVKVIL